jgi:sec-independent protein translocase protein TatA
MFDNMGFGEMLIIVLVVLVLFGAKKIPDLAQGLGKGIREFKKALKDVEDGIKTPAPDDKKPENKPDIK